MPKSKPAKPRASLKPDRITQAELRDRLHIYNIVQKAVWSLGRRLADGVDLKRVPSHLSTVDRWVLRARATRGSFHNAVVQRGPLHAALIGKVPENFEPVTALEATEYGVRIGRRRKKPHE
jgi:hypothetical protein